MNNIQPELNPGEEHPADTPSLSAFYNGRRVFVTGGTGFVGRYVVSRLVELGAIVVCVVRHERRVSELARSERVIPLVGDLANDDQEFWRRGMEGSSRIFHLAAAGASHSVQGKLTWRDYLEVNTRSVGTLMHAAQEASVPVRFVLASTFCEYGAGLERLMRPDDCLRPTNIYGMSKASGSMLAQVLAEELGIQLVLLRCFHPYGPHEPRTRLVPTLIRKALAGEKVPMTEGKQVWDFVYVKDMAEAYIAAGVCRLPPPGRATFAIGTGQGVSMAQVARAVMALIPENGGVELGAIPYRKNEMWHMVPDISATRSLLGWHAKHSLTQGLRETIDHERATT